MGFKKEEILRVTNIKLIKDETQVQEFDISTDTRTLKEGDLYLPLKGANFDGENFLDKAIESGAEGCFITGNEFPQDAEIVFKVEDTLLAYLELAKVRKERINPKILAITGSSGKTTTKEMLYAMTGRKFKVHKTLSNYNNEVGLCQTILAMPEDTEVLILEMGMRGPGEIELLSKYANPDYTIITNVGTAHIGRLLSVDNIAKAKCEIALHQKKEGTFIAHDDERIRKFVNFDGNQVYYSLNDVEILEKKQGYSRFTYKSEVYELNVDGDYNIENSLGGIEAGKQLGMTYEEIREGLKSYKPIEKRGEIVEAGGFTFINDSYNANPESMKAAVCAFVESYENPLIILGDMAELGEDSAKFHAQTGRYFAQKFLGRKDVKFLTVGPLSRNIAAELCNEGFFVQSFDTNLEVSRYILDNKNISNTIFLKASRSMKFEEIIANIKGDK